MTVTPEGIPSGWQRRRPPAARRACCQSSPMRVGGRRRRQARRSRPRSTRWSVIARQADFVEVIQVLEQLVCVKE